jgi:hypothetical protein
MAVSSNGANLAMRSSVSPGGGRSSPQLAVITRQSRPSTTIGAPAAERRSNSTAPAKVCNRISRSLVIRDPGRDDATRGPFVATRDIGYLQRYGWPARQR